MGEGVVFPHLYPQKTIRTSAPRN